MSCAHDAVPVGGQCPACLLELAANGEPELAAGTVIAERFRIVAPLGRGGMGEVYRADDLKLGHAVAVKLVPATEATLREVRAGREIAHPNVCRIYDVFDVDANAAIVMELVDGEALSSMELPRARALQVARDICSGLEAIHESGLAHGDLKPSNVMIDRGGRARITDFGLSHRAGEATRFGGTPAYMAPEQFATRAATRQSDVYALGVLLSELIGADDPIIARCLSRDPALRPTAGEVLAAIAGTPSPEYVAASEEAWRLTTVQAWSIAAAAMALLALLVALRPRAASPLPPASTEIGTTYTILLALTIAAGAVLAWRNLRAGRVDRAGAARAALWVFACDGIARLLAAQHSTSVEAEASVLTTLAGAAALLGVEVWIAYAALEPYARRNWPQALVSWIRLLHRRARDPLVARDFLVGIAAGLGMALIDLARGTQAHTGVASAVAHSLARGVFYALFALFFLVLLRMALRSSIVAAIVWLIATTAMWSRTPGEAPLVAAQMLVVLILLHRLGLLAAAVAVSVLLMAAFV